MPKDVTTLLADYQKDYSKAKEPSDKVLRTEASKIAAQLVQEGRADDAKQVAEQMEIKLAGKPLSQVHPTLADLLALYDAAVANAAQPIRERYTRRADALVQKYAGKDMTAVLALADVKNQIEGKSPAPAPATPPSPSSTSSASTLAPAGQVWKGTYGQYSFNPDGTGIKATPDAKFKFLWKVVGPNELEYVEIGEKGGRMNRRIWTFDAPREIVTVTDPTKTYGPTIYRRVKS
ncbi:hypothetical protein [Prosthecobacter fusiformis]|uniref:hypothetical protein n=1 Tax=Prosthecobacter fusiformis TaxID=48464 RepID=UPI0010617A4A|nr:hypothetical protein [Prosthecobacter fusiformis]